MTVAARLMRKRHVYRSSPLIEEVLKMRHSNGREALKIVRCYRRHRFRALLHNRIFQRRLGDMRRRNAACTIQRQWRAHVERRMVFELRKKLNAARAIQKIARGTMARSMARKIRARAARERAARRAQLLDVGSIRKAGHAPRNAAAAAASGSGSDDRDRQEGWGREPFVGRDNFVRWMMQTQALGAVLALQHWWRRVIGPHLQLWRWQRTKNRAAEVIQRFTRARAWRRWF